MPAAAAPIEVPTVGMMFGKHRPERFLMNTVDPVRKLAERLGRTTNQFAPGTPLYSVVERARSMVHEAHTRDDVHRTLVFMDDHLRRHLFDGPRDEFIDCKRALERERGPLS